MMVLMQNMGFFATLYLPYFGPISLRVSVEWDTVYWSTR